MILVHQPAGIAQHDGKQIRGPAEKEEEKSRQPGTDRSDPVAHRAGLARVWEARIVGVIGERDSNSSSASAPSSHSVPSRNERATAAAESLIVCLGFLGERLLRSNLDL